MSTGAATGDTLGSVGLVALVTGGGRGIGGAAARLLAENGTAVCVADIDGRSAAEVARAIRGNGGRAMSSVMDVTDLVAVEATVESVISEWGRLDCLFANAGLGEYGDVVETSPEQWNRVLGVNLTGVFLTARACIPHMISGGGGAIVATSSDCVIRTCARSAAYVAAKSGIAGLMRSIAVDFGSHGIRANTVFPGVTDTPGLRKIYGGPGAAEAGLGKARHLSPLGRVGSPDDVARAACFLLSKDAEHITGADLVVDGGMTITYEAD